MAEWYDAYPAKTPAGSRVHVRNAVPGCRDRGCQAPELAALANRLSEHAHGLLEKLDRKEGQMDPTRALWCEQGGHSFSEKDPDFQVLTITGRDKEGKQVTESRTICGPCAAQTKTSLGSARNNPVPELPAES